MRSIHRQRINCQQEQTQKSILWITSFQYMNDVLYILRCLRNFILDTWILDRGRVPNYVIYDVQQLGKYLSLMRCHDVVSNEQETCVIRMYPPAEVCNTYD
jgi:hypothetical protein